LLLEETRILQQQPQHIARALHGAEIVKRPVAPGLGDLGADLLAALREGEETHQVGELGEILLGGGGRQ
jgi:hypothetical protein